MEGLISGDKEMTAQVVAMADEAARKQEQEGEHDCFSLSSSDTIHKAYPVNHACMSKHTAHFLGCAP
jgi:hypothetical protein